MYLKVEEMKTIFLLIIIFLTSFSLASCSSDDLDLFPGGACVSNVSSTRPHCYDYDEGGLFSCGWDDQVSYESTTCESLGYIYLCPYGSNSERLYDEPCP